MKEPRYDEGQWPIVVVTLPPYDLEEPQLSRHLDRMTSYCKRGVPFVQIIDVRGSETLSANARRIVAERMDHDEVTYPGVILGVAIVLSTALHRGIFKAISWLSTKSHRLQAFGDVDEALGWARELVAVPHQSMTMPVAKDVSKQVG